MQRINNLHGLLRLNLRSAIIFSFIVFVFVLAVYLQISIFLAHMFPPFCSVSKYVYFFLPCVHFFSNWVDSSIVLVSLSLIKTRNKLEFTSHIPCTNFRSPKCAHRSYCSWQAGRLIDQVDMHGRVCHLAIFPYDYLRASPSGGPKPTPNVRADSPDSFWPKNRDPTTALKATPNVRAVRHTPNPAHMWGGFVGVRTRPDRPPRRTRPNMTPHISENSPPRSEP